MSRNLELQRIIRLYREETGESELDMHEIARFALSKGWPMPKPKSPIDLLAEQITGRGTSGSAKRPRHEAPISRVSRRTCLRCEGPIDLLLDRHRRPGDDLRQYAEVYGSPDESRWWTMASNSRLTLIIGMASARPKSISNCRWIWTPTSNGGRTHWTMKSRRRLNHPSSNGLVRRPERFPFVVLR